MVKSDVSTADPRHLPHAEPDPRLPGPHAGPPPPADGDHPMVPAPGLFEGPLAIRIVAVLLIFYALYFSASLLVPIVCAALLGMMLAPLVHGLERLYVPRPIAATIVVIAAVSTLAMAITLLAGPAQSWMERAPEGLRRLEQRLEPLKRSIETISQAREKLQDAAQGAGEKAPQRVLVVRPALIDLMVGTPHVIAPALSVFMLMFLLLVAGDIFLRKLVAIIPTFKEKKRTVEIIRAIEGDISYYLLAFAALNIGMGVAMGIATALLGIPNPILWAALIAVLNCVPYVGPLVSMGVLALVGITTFDSLSLALAAPAIMLILSVFSAQVVMPLVLGRGLRLNPVAIFISVMLWGWLWGIVGVLLAVPLLASFKIVCERIEPLAPFAEFLTQYVPPSEED